MKEIQSVAMLATLATTFIINNNLIHSEAVCGADVQLCRDKPQVIDTNLCMSQDIKWSMPSCCSAESIDANACPKKPEPTCRIVELSTPFSVSTDECCAELALTFEWSQISTSCCRTCSCFGDPHCIGFNDQVDSWIICDGRTKNEDAVYGKELFCPIKKNACEGQLDHLGNKCVYKNTGKETVDESGSPCQSTYAEPATMVMYKTEKFELLLSLGDRGIIDGVRLTNGDQVYYAKSQPCASTNMPWRATPDATKPPDDPNWLPYSWTVENTNRGKVWYISGLETGIEIEMRCIFNKYGTVPRINVDSLADPLKKRPDESGVCVTGEIDKKLSTYQHTEDIKKFCRSSQSQGQAIEYFCGLELLNSPSKCMKTVCNSLASDAIGRDKCVSEIVKYQNDKQFQDGWERVWCAYNTLASKNPAECTEGQCLQCIFDVYDFTWGEAVERWRNFNTGVEGVGSKGPCIPFKSLNASLSDCENGLTYQYLDTDAIGENGQQTECWVDFLSIPEGRDICGGNVILLSSLAGANSKEANFFDKQIRIKQCNNQALCETSQPNECTPEYGVSGAIKLVPDPVTNRANLYWQLIRQNKLICSPADPDCLVKAYGAQLPQAKCTGCDYCKTK